MKTSFLEKTILTLLAIAPLTLPAASLTWDADPVATGAQDGSGTWDASTANWWTGSADTTFNVATPDLAIFGALNGIAGTVTLGAPIISSNIIFNAPGVGNYIIAGSGGNTLGLTNRTITANIDATISADIVGGPLTLGNSVANAPSGVLTLSGNNSYTGGLSMGVNAPNTTSAVRVNSANAFGTGTLSYNSQGNQTSGRVEILGGINITNPITYQGRNNPTMGIVAVSGANILSGTISGAAGGQHYGFQSEAANGLSLAGGLVMQTSATRDFVLGGSGGGTVNSAISGGTSTITVVKSGSGTWTLSGANTYAGNTTLGAGTLTLDYSAQNNSKLPDGGVLTLAGGTLNLSGGSHTEVVGSTTIAPGGSVVTRAGGSSTLNLGAITHNAGGTVDFGVAGVASTTTANVNGILGGYATVAGADWAVGGGAVAAYTGYTDIAASGSTIADGATSNVRLNSAGGGGNIALGAATTTINTLLQNTTTPATINTSTGILRLGATGGVLVPAGMQSVTVGTAPGSGALTAGGADSTPGEIVLINNSTNNIVLNSVVADNGTSPVSLTKSGSGTAALASANTYSGVTTVAGGTLNVSADGNLGTAPGVSTTNIVLNGGTLNATATFALNANRGIFLGSLNANGYNGGTISVAAGQVLTNNGVISGGTVNGSAGFTTTVGPGSLTKSGDGTLVLGGANTYAGGTFINAGTISITSSGNLGTQPGCYIPDHVVLNGGTLEATTNLTLGSIRGIMLGPVGSSGSGTFQVDSGATLQLDSRIADNWNGAGSLTKTGPGSLILTSGFNDYSGDTTVSNGLLQLANARALPNGSDKGNVIINSPGALGIVTSGGNVFLKGLSGNGTVDNPSNFPVSLTLGFYNTSSTFNGVIQNSGGGPLTLVKTGSGTLTLSGGANTYSGSTLINSGILALGTSATIANSANIVVGAGSTLDVIGLAGGLTLAAGQQLSGSGTVQGNVTDPPASIIAPGGAGTAGTLTFANNLTLSGSGALNFDLATAITPGGGVNDLVVVTGTLNIAGPTTISLNYLGGLPGVGTYILFQYGSLIGNVANLLVPIGFTLTNNATDKTIGLIVTHVPNSLTWVGDGLNNVWDSGTTANWKHAGTNEFFFVGDNVTFDDTGSAAPPISLAGTMFPSAVTVNASQTYDFVNGGIGSGNLSKSGGGTLILENTNTYTGPTAINGGILQVGNNNGVGTLGAGLITNNATLVFNRTNTITVATNISGSGTVTQSGTGDLTLSASNTFTGGVTVNNGRVLMQHLNALGTGSAVVNPGGEIYLLGNSGVISPGAMTLNGSGPASDGALRKGNQTTSTFGGTVTLGSDTTLNVDGNGAVLNLTNAAGINGAAVNASLTLAGAGAGNITGPLSLASGNLTVSGGTWTVAPSNSYSGLTFINGGALLITAPASLGPVPVSFNASQVTLSGGSLGAATNVTLDDGNIGITVSDQSTASGIVVSDANATFVISNNITGSGSGVLTKTGPGRLVLVGPNTFAGTWNIDGGGTANDGMTVIARNQAIANITPIAGFPSFFIRDNNAGSSTLALDGTQESITIAPDISLAGRNNTVPAIENLAGSNTISGNITMVVGGGNYEIQSDSGTLVLSAPLPFATPISLPVRTNTFLGAGNIIVSGVIQDYSLGGTNVSIMVVKQGTGVLTLPANNTYTGPTVVTNGVLSLTGTIGTNTTTVSGGLLVGTGTINGPVTVSGSGAIEAGSTNAIGTLNLTSSLALSGNTIVKINKTAGTRDLFSGQTGVTYGGTLAVTNLSGTLTTSDTFTLFSPGASASNFAGIIGSPGPGLAYSFTNGVLSVVTGVANNPTNITVKVSGSTLTLSWPSDHAGWILQAQTNALGKGLSTNWADVAGSGASNTNVSTINPTNPAVFYRLRH